MTYAVLNRYDRIAILSASCLRVRDRSTGVLRLVHAGPIKPETLRLLEQSGKILEKTEEAGTLYLVAPDEPALVQLFTANQEMQAMPDSAATVVFRSTGRTATAARRDASPSPLDKTVMIDAQQLKAIQAKPESQPGAALPASPAPVRKRTSFSLIVTIIAVSLVTLAIIGIVGLVAR